ncbi:MAG: ribose 5-phosphate isomerase B [bacterium]
MRVAIGCDHAGYILKPMIVRYLISKNVEVLDQGTDSLESVDYPDYAEKVAVAVADGLADYGILICGTGLGMAISANKVPGVRAVTVTEPFSAEMARAHNDANVLTMGSRVIGTDLAIRITEVFISTLFEGGRHSKRLDKISLLESRDRTGDEQL